MNDRRPSYGDEEDNFFFKPHTVTALVFVVGSLIAWAFFGTQAATPVDNVKTYARCPCFQHVRT